ncbi:GTPase [Micrococcus luteus]|uniref:GTPase n=4 Tax=Micrococcus luteus TaxID=1270 RepID=UPI00288D7041|nr:GTPase [Micrococcus luteus]MDT1991044.1 50S ribosome-binding GTPase [Micrococcus luteus]
MSRRDTPALAPRLDALGEAAELAAGRLPEDVVAGADAVVRAAGERQALSAEHTVVGFFGATGSGKSSLFNALTGRDLARVAATRPTTSEPLAAVWGVGRGQGLASDAEHGDGTGEGGGAAALLDWLGVRRRHLLDEAPVLDDGRPGFLGLGRRDGADATGLILLDLPDIDSVERGNREITSRLAGHVDVLVWVVDPEKYADAVLHREFLATMGSHAAVTLVLLNQVDRLSVRDRDVVLASLRRMLSGHGLGDVRVLPVSARTGEGLEEVGRQVAAIVAQRGAAAERLGADVAARAADLAAASGEGEPAGVGPGDEQRLGRELAVAGGVPAVVRAVEGSYRLRSAKRTSWPALRWMHSFRADPLRRLHLMPERTAPRRDRDEVARDPALHRTSLPERSGTQRAVVDGAVRTLAAAAGAGASEPWAAAIRRAGREHAEELPGAVDQAIAATDLGAGRGSWWHPVLDVLQWLALLTAVVGAGWLGVLALAGYLQFPLPPAPTVEGFPLPTLLLVGGLALGVLLALLAIPLTRWTAAARGRRARRRLEEATTDVGRRLVVDPVRAEVDRFHAFRDALARASGLPVRRGRR